MKTLLREGAVCVLLLAALSGMSVWSKAQESTDTVRKAIVKSPPVYPQLARNMHIQGVVKLEALVAPNGTVKSVEVKGGHPLLTQSAVTSVQRWKFEPSKNETKEQIEIRFNPQ